MTLADNRPRSGALGRWRGRVTSCRSLAALPDVDWSKPITAWSKDQMVSFLLEALRLIHAAMIARDVGGGIATRRKSLEEMQRVACRRDWRSADDARRAQRPDRILSRDDQPQPRELIARSAQRRDQRAIEQASLAKHASDKPRGYLGASLIGDDCLRKIQFEWMTAVDISGAGALDLRARALLRDARAATAASTPASCLRRSRRWASSPRTG